MIRNIIKKIDNRKASICVIGLGYVGLPLLIRLAEARFKNLTGYDIDKKKINSLKKSISYINQISDHKIKFLKKKNVKFESNIIKKKKDYDFFIICLPTPIYKNKSPDLSAIKTCINNLKKIVRPYQTIIFESTSYPFTTKELFYDSFLSKKFNVGKNFFLVFSPEREDPGNKKIKMKYVTKLISGYSTNCIRIVKTLYSTCYKKLFITKNIETAEMSKLFENSFRAINISYVNEMKNVCEKFGINIFDVIKACSTKPFGFMPFYPGPGIGGHCIPVDPYLLNWKIKKIKNKAEFLNLALNLNSNFTDKIFGKIIRIIKKKKYKRKPNIMIVGVSYKKNIEDVRESPALKIIDNFLKKKFSVKYYDPYVKELILKNVKMKSQKKLKITKNDLVIIITDHDNISYNTIKSKSKIIVDTRGKFIGDNENIFNL